MLGSSQGRPVCVLHDGQNRGGKKSELSQEKRKLNENKGKL